MKIVGFGDSFIMDKRPCWAPEFNNTYQGILSQHYDCQPWFNPLLNEYERKPEFRGVPGTGPWSAFFDWLDYPDKENIDVVIFAWSECVRLYHNTVYPLNTASVLQNAIDSEYKKQHKEVFTAAEHYYKHLLDERKANYEMSGLLALVDNMTKNYPKTKFINMFCFTEHDTTGWWGNTYKTAKPEDLKYNYDFNNSVQIRPALMYLSMKEEWPDHHTMEKRHCHLSKNMHRLVGEALIDAIDGYRLGRTVNIKI